MRKLVCVTGLAGLAALLVVRARGEKAQDNGKAREALKAWAEEFIAANNNGDALAVSAFWTVDGDYLDQGGTTEVVYSDAPPIAPASDPKQIHLDGKTFRWMHKE